MVAVVKLHDSGVKIDQGYKGRVAWLPIVSAELEPGSVWPRRAQQMSCIPDVQNL